MRGLLVKDELTCRAPDAYVMIVVELAVVVVVVVLLIGAVETPEEIVLRFYEKAK